AFKNYRAILRLIRLRSRGVGRLSRAPSNYPYYHANAEEGYSRPKFGCNQKWESSQTSLWSGEDEQSRLFWSAATCRLFAALHIVLAICPSFARIPRQKVTPACNCTLH